MTMNTWQANPNWMNAMAVGGKPPRAKTNIITSLQIISHRYRFASWGVRVVTFRNAEAVVAPEDEAVAHHIRPEMVKALLLEDKPSLL